MILKTIPMNEYIAPACHEQIRLLYADDDLLVVSKPAGLLTVPGRLVKDCVLSRMRYQYPDAVIVHRLDLDTSGLLILARSKLAVSDLTRQFRERLVLKEYIADVFGKVEHDQDEISLAIAPDPHRRPGQLIDQANGKSALTFYEVMQRGTDATRLRLKPQTGRTHQLRIHLAAIGHPILGCDLYAHHQAFRLADRLHLHASLVEFDHPASGVRRQFRSAVPF